GCSRERPRTGRAAAGPARGRAALGGSRWSAHPAAGAAAPGPRRAASPRRRPSTPARGRSARARAADRKRAGARASLGGLPTRRRPSRAAELEVELSDLELLVRVRRPLDVLLHAVVLVRLDHGQPGQILEEDLGHVPIGLAPELLVDGEARRVAQ